MKKIVIRKLFGKFDYDIRLSDTGMTILTGPNGFGKSTILRCIRAIADGDVEYFRKLDFKKIRIVAENKKNNLTLNKDQEALFINGKKAAEYLKSDNKKEENSTVRLEQRKKQEEYYRLVNEWIQALYSREESEESLDPFIESKWDNQWFNRRILYYMKLLNKKRSPLFYEMHCSVGELFYIGEQRLIRAADSDYSKKSGIEKHIIREEEEIPGKLKSEMSRVAERYSNVANRLDSTFPQRLFAERNGITHQEFNARIAVMQDNVEKLKKYDISDIGELEDIQFREEDSRALKVYFEDFEKSISNMRR